MSARVLVVDDEIQIQRMLKTVLEAQGYTVQMVADGQAAIEVTASWRPDVILLDLGLPILNGFEVCRRIRGWSQVPIIVVSGRTSEDDTVAALDIGADDYMAKPFGTRELLARIRVALRHGARLNDAGEPVVSFGHLEINWSRRLVTHNGAEVRLTPTEYNLLAILSGHAGKVLTHRAILRAIWGPSSENDVNTLRVFINQLRRKIEPDPAHPILIMTEPGIGYRFRLEG